MGKPELKIDPDLVAKAEAAGVDIARVAESALRVAPMLRRSERPAYTKVSVPVDFANQELWVSLAELVVVERQ